MLRCPDPRASWSARKSKTTVWRIIIGQTWAIGEKAERVGKGGGGYTNRQHRMRRIANDDQSAPGVAWCPRPCVLSPQGHDVQQVVADGPEVRVELIQRRCHVLAHRLAAHALDDHSRDVPLGGVEDEVDVLESVAPVRQEISASIRCQAEGRSSGNGRHDASERILPELLDGNHGSDGRRGAWYGRGRLSEDKFHFEQSGLV